MSGFTRESSSVGGGGVTAPQMPYFYVSGFFGSNVALTGVQSPTSGTATNGQVVLVANNSTPSQNGIYIVNTGGAWSRDPSYTSALIPVAKVILDVAGGVYEEFLANPPVSFVLGTSNLPYSNPYSSNSAGASTFRPRGAGSAGAIQLQFHASGQGAVGGGGADCEIIRNAGANGSLDFNNYGTGDVTFYSAGSSGQFFFQNSPVIANGGFGSSNTVITSGTSSTLTTIVSCAVFNPASTIATYTLTLPTSPKNGTRIKIAGTNVAGGAVTALTLTPGGTNTIDGAITSLAANAFAEYMFVSSIGVSGKWVRIG